MSKFKTSLLLALTLMAAGCSDTNNNSQFAPGVATQSTTAFVDSTATLSGQISLGNDVYVAPFVNLNASGAPIIIGSKSDVQDNATINSTISAVTLGDNVILAHGCTVIGPATIGATGDSPAFVGFNAEVEGATVEPGAMIDARARLGPGLTLHRGKRILPGQDVTTQDEADDLSLGKVILVNAAAVDFMNAVLAVNIDLAHGYAAAQASDANSVQGIGVNPVTSLHSVSETPLLAGQRVLDPGFRNRIVGQVILADALAALNLNMGSQDSLRADEGAPFNIGTIAMMDNQVTMHALEHSQLQIGNNCTYGLHCVIHGGEDAANSPPATTTIGNDVQIGARAVVFRSTVGDSCVIGDDALIDGSQLAPGTVIPARTIMVQNVVQGTIDW